ncbi:class I SAM-dependent methyltransferase [Paenibacillus marinisediminis]
MSSIELMNRIKQQLSQYPDNRMPFSNYMSYCLYEPEFGYYRTDRLKVGREGDFYTSVQIGSIMSEMIANDVQERCRTRGWRLSEVTVVEWGAGTGRLASQLISLWRAQEKGPACYAMVETSPYHRTQARNLLHSMDIEVDGSTVAAWDEQDVLNAAVNGGKPMFIIANELLDALPVERVRLQGDRLEMAYVGWNEVSNSPVEVWKPAEAEVSDWIEKHRIELHNGQIYDAHIAGAAWIMKMWSALQEAEGIYIDYGDISEELTAPYRMNGTLMCYCRHQAHDNPYINIGTQDITSFVDFDVYKAAFLEAGCTVQPLISQQQYLLDNGLLNELRNHDARDPFSEAAKRNRAIRQLLLSDQMSERFKVLRLRK